MRLTIALAVGAFGTVVACTQLPQVQVAGPLPSPWHVGDKVQLPQGIVGTLLPSGQLEVRVRVRSTGDAKQDVVTIACDPALVRHVR